MFNEKTMAGGGIVAFDEGGSVPHFNGTAGSLVMGGLDDLTQRLQELKVQRQNLAANSSMGFRGMTPAQRRINDLDQQIAELENQYRVVAGRAGAYKKERDTLLSSNVPFGLPAAPAAAPAAPPAAAPAAAPAAGPGIPTLINSNYPDVKGPEVSQFNVNPAKLDLANAEEQYGRDATLASLKRRREEAGIKDIYTQQFADLENEKGKIASFKKSQSVKSMKTNA
jgi:hypothetical protein